MRKGCAAMAASWFASILGIVAIFFSILRWLSRLVLSVSSRPVGSGCARSFL